MTKNTRKRKNYALGCLHTHPIQFVITGVGNVSDLLWMLKELKLPIKAQSTSKPRHVIEVTAHYSGKSRPIFCVRKCFELWSKTWKYLQPIFWKLKWAYEIGRQRTMNENPAWRMFLGLKLMCFDNLCRRNIVWIMRFFKDISTVKQALMPIIRHWAVGDTHLELRSKNSPT